MMNRKAFIGAYRDLRFKSQQGFFLRCTKEQIKSQILRKYSHKSRTNTQDQLTPTKLGISNTPGIVQQFEQLQ